MAAKGIYLGGYVELRVKNGGLWRKLGRRELRVPLANQNGFEFVEPIDAGGVLAEKSGQPSRERQGLMPVIELPDPV